MIFSTKNAQPQSNQEKTSDKSKLRDILKVTDEVSSKVMKSQSHEKQETTEKVSQARED